MLSFRFGALGGSSVHDLENAFGPMIRTVGGTSNVNKDEPANAHS
jgi:hypothetical protein